MAVTRDALAEELEALMQAELDRYYDTVPYARHLTGAEETLHKAYYVRHRIETVKRIRGTSRTDALALAALVRENYEASRAWSRYVAEELSHDVLYLRDLAEHGLTADDVLDAAPLPATGALLAHLEEAIAERGALPAVAYSLFVEWNSTRASATVVEQAEKAFSARHVRGSRAHTKIDEREDHYGMMIDIAHSLVGGSGREHVLYEEITTISALLRRYFVELYETTVQREQFAGEPIRG